MSLIFFMLGAGLALIYLTQIARGKPAEGHPLRSLAKTAATLALVAAGLASQGDSLLGPARLAPLLIILGLALGSAGDFCLSRPGQAMFLAGMAAFAAGHLAYTAAFWLRTGSPSFGLASAALGVATLGLGLWLSARAESLRLPVLGYALVIGFMAAVALILPDAPGTKTLQAGVALFLVSDILLALRLFVMGAAAQRPLDLVVWPAYWLGQALILTGAIRY